MGKRAKYFGILLFFGGEHVIFWHTNTFEDLQILLEQNPIAFFAFGFVLWGTFKVLRHLFKQ